MRCNRSLWLPQCAASAIVNRPLPTERKVMRCIYEMYESLYPGKMPRENDPFIAIDIHAVSARLGCKPHLLFGYLYYYLEHKHRHQTGPNAYISLFAVQAGALRHAVNFPYLAAILSTHDQEHSRYKWTLGISVVSLALSVGAIIAQVVAK